MPTTVEHGLISLTFLKIFIKFVGTLHQIIIYTNVEDKVGNIR